MLHVTYYISNIIYSLFSILQSLFPIIRYTLYILHITYMYTYTLTILGVFDALLKLLSVFNIPPIERTFQCRFSNISVSSIHFSAFNIPPFLSVLPMQPAITDTIRRNSRKPQRPAPFVTRQIPLGRHAKRL